MSSAPLALPLVRRSPEELGIPAAALLALADRLAEEGLDPHALLVARHGAVAFEAAWAPYRLDRPALVYSASKTFTSLAIGFLADEGRLSLDAAAADLLAVLAPLGAPVITVRHLLTMNTGHTSAQIDALGEDPRDLLRVAPEAVPGSHFAYSSPATHALSAIVTALTGEALTAYLRPRLLDPLGIGQRWMRPRGGIEHGASGYHLTVEDLARVAIMLASGGAFRDTQVAPAWYVEEMSRAWSVTADVDGPAAADGEVGDWSRGYGYQVWRSAHGFRLDGAAGQFGLVIPEHDLVIAYQGAAADTQATLRAFWAFVDAVADADAAGGADPALDTALDPALDPAGKTALAASVVRDSWDARDRIAPWPWESPFDSNGLALADAGDANGWTLTLPGVGDLPVATAWREVVITASAAPGQADRLTVATRGETCPDGSVLVHVVDTTSPHRAIVTRDASGAATGAWHVPPLWNGWPGLRVPSMVTEATVDAAAVLLDMDGTLVDSTAVVERLWTQWALEHDVDPARALGIIHGRQGQDSMALLLPDRPHEVNLAENRELLAAETAQTDGVVAIPGAAALLADLAGLPHALVTSATLPLARARMDAAGLPMPALAVTAEDVTRSKPDPEGFVAAARALGVEPADCIVVEDSPNGIAAGLGAGMRVIGIGPHAAAAGPTWLVADAAGIHVAPADGGAGVRVTITG